MAGGDDTKSSSSSQKVDPMQTQEVGAQVDVKKAGFMSGLKDRVHMPAFDREEATQMLQSRLQHQRIEGLDYTERDPRQLHREIKVNFRDVIAEPTGAHSFETVWGTSMKTYSITKYWTYRILTMVLGIPFALFWGLYFACLAFINVWCVVPFVKGFVIQMNFFKQVWGLLVGTFLDPFFMSIGKIFSQIKIHLSHNRS